MSISVNDLKCIYDNLKPNETMRLYPVGYKREDDYYGISCPDSAAVNTSKITMFKESVLEITFCCYAPEDKFNVGIPEGTLLHKNTIYVPYERVDKIKIIANVK